MAAPTPTHREQPRTPSKPLAASTPAPGAGRLGDSIRAQARLLDFDAGDALRRPGPDFDLDASRQLHARQRGRGSVPGNGAAEEESTSGVVSAPSTASESDRSGGRCVTEEELDARFAEVDNRDAANLARQKTEGEAADIMSTVGGLLGHIYTTQSAAVTDVEMEARGGPEPDLLIKVLSSLLDSVLVGGLGFVMAKVAQVVVQRATATLTGRGLDGALLANAIEDAKAVGDGVKDAGKQAAKSGASTALASVSGGTPSPDAYFWPLRKGLDDAGRATVLEHEEMRRRVRASSAPVEVANAIRDAMVEAAETAREAQRAKAMDGWATYVARADQGTTSEGGTDLADDVGHGADAGLLSIHLQLGLPGKRPTVISAEIEGLSDALVRRLGARRFAELDLPVVIEGELPFPYDSYPTAEVDLARNESGRLWVEKDDPGALVWLNHRAGGKLRSPVGKEGEAMAKSAEEGARRLVEVDMADVVLGGKLG